MEQKEQSSCTEDRIEHVLERCLCDLGLDTPDKQLWNAGLCINRWCLEELVKRQPDNFLILLHRLLRKTTQVLERCEYDLVVPLTLLFSSTLLKAPHVSTDCGLLLEANSLFHRFLSWPEPCSSASRRLLHTIHQELRAPGISFQRLVRAEQGISSDTHHHSKTMTVLLVSPDGDTPPEVQHVSHQLGMSHSCTRDITITLIIQAVQAVLGTTNLKALYTALQNQLSEELDDLLQTLTVSLEQSASTADHSEARHTLVHSIDTLTKRLLQRTSTVDTTTNTGSIESLVLPLPKCHVRTWESDNFDVLHDLLTGECDADTTEESFLNGDVDDKKDISLDEEDETEVNNNTIISNNTSNNRISTVSSTSGDSMFSSHSLSSSWSVSAPSSGIDSDFSEDLIQEDLQKPRRKPKKKSKSLLGVERFSLLFKNPRSPLLCRRAQSMGCQNALPKNVPQPKPPSSPVASPQKHLCVRRRPILSSDITEEPGEVTRVRVVVFGGDKEVGRLARAYTDLQVKDSKHRRLTKTCKLRFYFVPTRRRHVGYQGTGEEEGVAKSSVDGIADSSTNVAHMLGLVDPWYERNVLSLLSLSSDILCQSACKDGGDSVSSGPSELPSLLTDMVLYYCRHADQCVLMQLYQAKLTMAGGEKRIEVFVHSLELGHSAGTRAVKAMGAVSKRLGIAEEREAVPLTLNIEYNKVAVSGRSQWIKTEKDCTSVNLHKACRTHEQLESLQLTMAEVKRQSKKSSNQFSMSAVMVDKAQVHAGSEGSTFAVCLDRDEKKFIQSVVSCEVSLCCKTSSPLDWRTYSTPSGQVQPLHPSYCSLLCLPLCSFCPTPH